MSLLQAIMYGIIQGLTEFLPISSSGHLRFVPALLGWRDPGAAFTAVIQMGTLAAVLIYFRADIARIVTATLRALLAGKPFATQDARMGWMIVLGTIPIVALGLLLKPLIEGSFRSLYVVATTLVLLALVLAAAEQFVARRQRQGAGFRTLDGLAWADALIVGLAQCLALVPGVSRSGATITGGLFLGMTRETAARFSFLLSLPSIFAAGLFEFLEYRHEILASSEQYTAIIVATLVSGIVGYAAIAFLLNFLRRNTTYVFVAYRIVVGLLLFGLLGAGVLQP